MSQGTLKIDNMKNGLLRISTTGVQKQVWGFTLGYKNKDVPLGVDALGNEYQGGILLEIAKDTGESSEYSEIPAQTYVGQKETDTLNPTSATKGKNSMITIVRNVYTGYSNNFFSDDASKNLGGKKNKSTDKENDFVYLKVKLQNVIKKESNGQTFVSVPNNKIPTTITGTNAKVVKQGGAMTDGPVAFALNEGDSEHFVDFPLSESREKNLATQLGLGKIDGSAYKNAMKSVIDGRSRFHNGTKFVDVNDFLIDQVTLSDYPINTKLAQNVETVTKFYQEESDISGAASTITSSIDEFDASNNQSKNMDPIIINVTNVAGFPDASSQNPQYVRVAVATTPDTREQTPAGEFRIKNNFQLLKYVEKNSSNNTLTLSTHNTKINASASNAQIKAVHPIGTSLDVFKLTVENIKGFPGIVTAADVQADPTKTLKLSQNLLLGSNPGVQITYNEIDYDNSVLYLTNPSLDDTYKTRNTTVKNVTGQQISGGQSKVTSLVLFDSNDVTDVKNGYTVVQCGTLTNGETNAATSNQHNLDYTMDVNGLEFEREQDISSLTTAQSGLLSQCQSNARASALSAQKQAQQIIGLSNNLAAQQARYREFEQKWLPSSKGDQLKVILAAIARYNTTSEQ